MTVREFGRQIAEYKRQNDPPMELPDGTPITPKNKENETTYDYFVERIYDPDRTDANLKGPFLNNNRQPLTSAQQEAVINNLTKHINHNMAVDAHIIDTLGLDETVISALKEALKNSRVKIIYLE